MKLRKSILLISLLFGVCFAYGQGGPLIEANIDNETAETYDIEIFLAVGGTLIDVPIDNETAETYDIEIFLVQGEVEIISGSLTFTAFANNTTVMNLVITDTDICIDKVKATCNCDPGNSCTTSAELDVDCYNEPYDDVNIGPEIGEDRCNEFSFYDFIDVDDLNEHLKHWFSIGPPD